MKPQLTNWSVWKIVLITVSIYLLQVISTTFISLPDLISKLHFNPFNIFGIGLIYYILLLWFWQVAHILDKALDKNVKLQLSRFKIFFWLTTATLIIIMFQKIILLNLLDFEVYSSFNFSYFFQFWSLLLEVIQLISIFYLSYFIGRSIQTYDTKTEIPLHWHKYITSIISVFFLLFGGIFFIQPSVNKIKIL